MKRRPHDILPSLRISTEEMKLPPGQTPQLEKSNRYILELDEQIQVQEKI
jgi:hypothetical protein